MLDNGCRIAPVMLLPFLLASVYIRELGDGKRLSGLVAWGRRSWFHVVDVAVSVAEGMMLLFGAGTLDLPYALVCRKSKAALGVVASVVHVAGGAPVL